MISAWWLIPAFFGGGVICFLAVMLFLRWAFGPGHARFDIWK